MLLKVGAIAICALLLAGPVAAGPGSGKGRRADIGKRRQQLQKRRAQRKASGNRLQSVLGRGKRANPNHPLRQQVRGEALLKAAISLRANGDPNLLPKHVRRALSKLVKRPLRDLRKPKVQDKILKLLENQTGSDAYLAGVGKQAAGLKRAAQIRDDHELGAGGRDGRDMQRGWGWQLLPKDDKAFYEPKYLSSVLRESGQTGEGMVHNAPARAKQTFDEAWSAIAPKNVRPEAFALTGSDANNLLYDVALISARKQYGKEVNHADILVMDGAYGGGRGRIAGTSFLSYGKGQAPDQSHLKIPSPVSFEFKPKGLAEVARLQKLEKAAIANVEGRLKAANAKKPIGGILIEPILGAKGVLFYRPQFLKQLRTLADKYKVPIFADEILTGGGRTGKFFAYEHYEGFEPDFVSFGKGIQVAGIARVSRGGEAPRHDYNKGMTTLTAASEGLLKGAQVLTRIKKDNLMENATRVGKYMVKKLRKHDKADAHKDSVDEHHPKGPTRGMGLLIFSENRGMDAMGGMGRFMPYLTLSKREVDHLVKK